MDDEKTNRVVEEEKDPRDTSDMSNQELKDAISQTLEKIRTQNLLLGAQSMCSVILQKIMEFEMKPGKRTLNDYRRLVKDIRGFCETGVSRKINADGTTSEKTEEETTSTEVQEPTES